MRAICRARCSIPMAARWSAANGSRNNQICYRLAPQQWEGRSVLRIVGSIVAGALTAFVLVWGIELIGHLIFPLPEDLDLRNPEVADQALGSIPLPAKLIVVFAWFTGALGGGYVASRIRGRWWSPWLIASLVALAAIVKSEEHTSELQSLMRISYAVYGLKKKNDRATQ